MSLINDALKRAKEAQNQVSAQPPAPAPALMPSEPTPEQEGPMGFLAPVTLAIVVVLALILIWQTLGNHQNTAGKEQAALPVAARTPTQTVVTPPLPTNEPPSGVVAQAAEPHVETAAAQTDPVAATPSGASTNLVQPGLGTDVPVSVKPAPLKLQAVVWNPMRPSAIVSGRTLFTGDRLGDLKVLKITQESITLAGPAQTNTLTLLQ